MQSDPNAVGCPGDASLSPSGEDTPRPRLSNLYYSILDTRRLLGDISQATTYRLIAAKKLDARKILGKTVVTSQSIEQLAAELPRAGTRRTADDAAISDAEPAQRPRQAAAVGASHKPEPTASGKMCPGCGPEGGAAAGGGRAVRLMGRGAPQ
jgi:hypothetical protein